MNYITSCPECGTQFLLQTEHLKAHRGKVQCGNCSHVFNAKNRLTEISDDITSAAEYQASLESAPEELLQVTENEATASSSEIEAVASEASNYIGEFSSVATEPEPIAIEDLTTDPKFSRKKLKLNLWYCLFSLILLILAALQTAYFMRTKLAAEYPQFKPLLKQGCALAHCEISLPKELDFLTIEDSDMQEDEKHQGVINFSSTLVNNASFTQTYPNIELTLTNAEDQPAIRRIIKPAEYLNTDTNINTGISANEQVHIKLAINASGTAVAGYRVLLVY